MLSETFQYDALNRLTKVIGPVTSDYSYDKLGNRYNAATPPGDPSTQYQVGTHRLAGRAGWAYTYNVDGTVSGRAAPSPSLDFDVFLYTTAGVLRGVDQRAGNKHVMLDYLLDADHQRVTEYRTEEIDGAPGPFQATHIVSEGVSPFFEEQGKYLPDGRVIFKWTHHIGTPEGIHAISVIEGATQTDILLARDHLGSVVATGGGPNIERLSFDAWGARRQATGGQLDPNAVSIHTDRGFTGHQMLDAVGLVHMNGRIYDPAIGRFLQPDPIVQAPHNLQNYNRYSYVMNNPLGFTDPTGFSWWKDNGQPAAKVVGAVVVAYFTQQWAYEWATYAGVSSPIIANGIAAAAGGFAAGGIMGGDLSSAAKGAGSALLTFGLIEAFSLPHSAVNAFEKPDIFFQKALVHATSGCASASLSGGSCGHGAAGTALGEFAVGLAGQDRVLQMVAGAVAGGVASKLAGGSWETGAFSAAFAYLFNQLGRVLNGTGHHMITNATARDLSFPQAALDVLDGPENRIPVRGHNGSSPCNGCVSHYEYSKAERAFVVRYLSENKLDPTKLSAAQTHDLVKAIKATDIRTISQFNRSLYMKAFNQALKRIFIEHPGSKGGDR